MFNVDPGGGGGGGGENTYIYIYFIPLLEKTMPTFVLIQNFNPYE